jgi:hypothetical protein
MTARFGQDDGSAVIDFVLTSMPVFIALQFMLGFLGLYGTSFIDARAAIFKSGQLAMADRENRVTLGYAALCRGNSSVVGLPRTCWHTKLEPTS